MASPRVLVFGYRDVGHACLETLVEGGANVVGVFTHEDDPGENAWFPSVASLARSHGIPVHTPPDVNTPEWIARVTELAPDILFSFYYRQLICPAILAIPRLGGYNMHGSLLPKYRGRAPVNWAILRGERETGATLHAMVERADAGDIVDQEAVPIGREDSVVEVSARVTAAARRVLKRSLPALLAGEAPRRPQDPRRASYFGRRRPEDGRIDWQRGAGEIFDLVRAVTHPFPGAYTEHRGEAFRIWWARPLSGMSAARPGEVVSIQPLRIATGRGWLEVIEWQTQRDARPQRGTGHGLSTGALLGAPNQE